MNGKTALILGGANGIGFQIAKAFCSVGCKVTMSNRKQEQGDESIDEIKKEYPNAEVDWIGADMGNLKQVREVFTKYRESHDRLDILVLSAGINSDQFGLCDDGYDRHFAVNWVGQFYVVNLVYPLLRKTSKMPGADAPRIIFESSEMHRFAPSNVHFGSMDEINDESIGSTQVYARTKLAMILGSKYGLIEKVINANKDNIYSLCVHPGAVNTQMQEQWKTAYPGVTGQLISAASKFVGRSVEQGSYSALWAATSPKVQQGFYYQDPDSPGKETSQASDKWLGCALWDLSHRIIKEKAGDDAMQSWSD